MARADRYTPETKKREYYSDFTNNFEENPLTGILARVTNEQAVGQAIKNIILTNVGERFYDSRKGSRVNYSLFEPFNPQTSEVLTLQIRECINAFEPRAVLHDIRFADNIDQNGINVTIVYSVINIPDSQTVLNLTVQRVR